jgi:hypothetical protein
MSRLRWDRSGCRERTCYCHDETLSPRLCSQCGCRPAKEVCAWELDFDGEVYDTDCGQSFAIIEGTLSENGMRFCCYCGKRLEEPFTREDYLNARG